MLHEILNQTQAAGYLLANRYWSAYYKISSPVAFLCKRNLMKLFTIYEQIHQKCLMFISQIKAKAEIRKAISPKLVGNCWLSYLLSSYNTLLSGSDRTWTNCHSHFHSAFRNNRRWLLLRSVFFAASVNCVSFQLLLHSWPVLLLVQWHLSVGWQLILMAISYKAATCNGN